MILAYISDTTVLEFLSGRFSDPALSPEELLVQLEDALERGDLSIADVAERLKDFSAE